MTQEDKELLLKDLCAKLPYGVKGRVYTKTTNGEYDINGEMIFFVSPFDVILDEINSLTEELHVVAIGDEDIVDFIEDQQEYGGLPTIDEFKPYLRPLSSMTKEEKYELKEILGPDIEINDGFVDILDASRHIFSLLELKALFDWFNKNHFDYIGLLSRGLAIEVTEENNPYK